LNLASVHRCVLFISVMLLSCKLTLAWSISLLYFCRPHFLPRNPILMDSLVKEIQYEKSSSCHVLLLLDRRFVELVPDYTASIGRNPLFISFSSVSLA